MCIDHSSLKPYASTDSLLAIQSVPIPPCVGAATDRYVRTYRHLDVRADGKEYVKNRTRARWSDMYVLEIYSVQCTHKDRWIDGYRCNGNGNNQNRKKKKICGLRRKGPEPTINGGGGPGRGNDD